MNYRRPLDERLSDFGAAVIIAVDHLPRKEKWKNISEQLNKCGTAPVAHYAEARSAESKRDFVHKMQLALKELRETHAWLQTANKVEANAFPSELVGECDELVAIMVAAVTTARRREGMTRDK
jgi:four helix bundle protein